MDFLPNPGNYGSFLPTHSYYANGTSAGTNTTAATQASTGMYLSPPVMPPSLLYPQLYGTMSHPSFQAFLGNDIRSVMDAAGFGTQRQESTIQADVSNIRTHQLQPQTDDVVVQTPSLGSSVLDSLRSPADHHNVWRPY